MDIKQYNRACSIRERIRQIDILLRNIENNSYEKIGIGLIGLNVDYRINENIKPVLHAMLLAEKNDLEKEFNNL